MERDYGGEQVLCVARSAIFPDGAWHGLVTAGLDKLLATIRRTAEFRPRARVEDDPSQQQLVPYCIVQHRDGSYLLTRRLGQGSEERLHHRYSLGVGGHVNPADAEHGDPVVGGLAREWAEEVICESPATARLVALINDDTTPVSRVHLGLVFMVEPVWGTVSIRERHKLAGETLDLDGLRPHRAAMETWSQLVFDDLLVAPRCPAPRGLTVKLAATGAPEGSAVADQP